MSMTLRSPLTLIAGRERRTASGWSLWQSRIDGRSMGELILVYALLALVLVETLYPLVWVLFGSLKTKDEVIANIWGHPLALSGRITSKPGASPGWARVSSTAPS